MKRQYDFHVYIDEFGDEGFGKLRSPARGGQSRWFMIGGVIVRSENDRKLPQWRDEILKELGRRDAREIHFKKLRHEQKVVACRMLREKPFGICVIASNKITIAREDNYDDFKNKGYLYNYLTELLLERITFACRVAAKQSGIINPKLRACFSRRRGTNYQEMREHFQRLKHLSDKGFGKNRINWEIFSPEDFVVENHAKRAGLQIADIVTSATGKALEPNLYGDIEPRYALLLKPRFLHQRGRILGAGLKLLPPIDRNPLNPDQLDFLSQLESQP